MAYDASLFNYFTPYKFETHKVLARCDGLHNSQPVRVLRKSPAGRCAVDLKYRRSLRADLAVTIPVGTNAAIDRNAVPYLSGSSHHAKH